MERAKEERKDGSLRRVDGRKGGKKCGRMNESQERWKDERKRRIMKRTNRQTF